MSAFPRVQYLTGWRLQLARRLLEQTGFSVARAAAEVGYESEAAFNRAFKKFVGVPPGAWRKGEIAVDRTPSLLIPFEFRFRLARRRRREKFDLRRLRPTGKPAGISALDSSRSHARCSGSRPAMTAKRQLRNSAGMRTKEWDEEKRQKILTERSLARSIGILW